MITFKREITTSLVLGLLVVNSSFAQTPSVILSDESRHSSLNSPLMSEEFQQKLDVVSNSKRMAGNEALLLVSGQMSYPVRFQLIDNAKKSIIISTFSLYGGNDNGEIADETSRLLVDKLISAKQDRGVEVRLIIDGATSVLAQSTLAVEKLRAAGIQVLKFNPIDSDRHDRWGGAAVNGLGSMVGGAYPVRNRWHEKTMIVDGEYAIGGGLNWGDVYGKSNAMVSSAYTPQEFYSHPLIQELGMTSVSTWGPSSETAWRDTDVLVRGPVVQEASKQLLTDFLLLEIMSQRPGQLRDFMNATEEQFMQAQALFESQYKNDAKYFPVLTSSTAKSSNEDSVRYISQRPFMDRTRRQSQNEMSKFALANGMRVVQSNPLLHMSNFYTNVIDKAEKQIVWGCHSNRPTPDILDALTRAANRGVKIYIMGNSPESARNLPDGGWLMYPLALCDYRDLMENSKGNVRIFEWQKSVERNGTILTAGAFHSKLFSVDGVLTSVGSYNISKASFRQHTEGTFVFNSPSFARSAEEMFQTDLQFTREMTLEELRDFRCRIPLMKFPFGSSPARKAN
ncbi:MAG: phosphatidylserine/phosphatidylglycerophosphate/cardiolipin synthase family protein [Proteobacteria bacterium]|nr:phosphatidylserine/phosphatidylglycerophosphate/cardiolipin synthase family protein [Pseudomonadota bacterium]